jgi:hypothetical protein
MCDVTQTAINPITGNVAKELLPVESLKISDLPARSAGELSGL